MKLTFQQIADARADILTVRNGFTKVAMALNNFGARLPAEYDRASKRLEEFSEHLHQAEVDVPVSDES